MSIATDYQFLSGRFGPQTHELEAVAIDPQNIVGDLSALPTGVYLRNGPNPVAKPPSRHHWFEGTGMIHSVQITDVTDEHTGKVERRAIYTNKYIHTTRFAHEQWSDEKAAGVGYHYSAMLEFSPAAWGTYALSTKIHGLLKLEGWNPYEPLPSYNAGVAQVNGKVYALSHDARPLEVVLPSLTTFPEMTLDGKLTGSVASNFKTCPTTGETYFLGAQRTAPYLTLSVIDATGAKGPSVDLMAARQSLINDFVLTQNSILFVDSAVVLNPANIYKKHPVYQFDKTAYTRVGIVARTAVTDRSIVRKRDKVDDICCPTLLAPAAGKEHLPFDDHDATVGSGLRQVSPKWFNVDTCAVLELGNGFETNTDGATAYVIVGIAFDDFDMDFGRAAKSATAAKARGGLTRWTLSETITGRRMVLTEKLCPAWNFAFPTVNPHFAGARNKFIFASVTHIGTQLQRSGNPFECKAIAKIDLETETVVAEQDFKGQCVMGSFSFVPRSSTVTAEDDGFLVGFVTPALEDPRTVKSWLVVLDAKTLAIHTRIEMPQRVPHGRGGSFVSGH